MLTLIADSSFYILFLDDIERSEYLAKILKTPSFKFLIGKVISEEISKSKNYYKIKDVVEAYVVLYNPEYDYGELLRPFLSENETKKGEGEVFAILFILTKFENVDACSIVDESIGRKRILSKVGNDACLFYSVEFVYKICYKKEKVLSKDELIDTLLKIRQSNFRIPHDKLDKILDGVRKDG